MFIEKDSYFIIEEFRNYGVIALFTKQNAGNMAVEVLDEEETVFENRKKLLAEFGKNSEMIFSAKQVHADEIHVIEEDESPVKLEGYDGFLTKNKEAVILMKFADCLPVFLLDTESKAFGMVHAGWRSSWLGIQQKEVRMMKELYNAKPENIIAGLGAGIGSCCYEVGMEFYEKYIEQYGKEFIESSFTERNGKIYYDNIAFNKKMLQGAGIPESNIYVDTTCTSCSGKFNSYRRDKERSGRNGGFIFLK